MKMENTGILDGLPDGQYCIHVKENCIMSVGMNASKEVDDVFKAAYNVIMAGTYGKNMPFTHVEAMGKLYDAVSKYQATQTAQMQE